MYKLSLLTFAAIQQGLIRPGTYVALASSISPGLIKFKNSQTKITFTVTNPDDHNAGY